MYRRLECTTWDDPWFSELPPESKLLFLYLITNRRTTACGVFEVTLRAIAFETGITDPLVVLASLGDRVIWWPEHQVIFVRNFYRWQSDATNRGNFQIGAMRALSEFPEDVQATVGDVYPELAPRELTPSPTHKDPIPIPSPRDSNETPRHGEEETVTVTVEEEETVEGEEDEHTARSAPVRVSYPDDFEVFWNAYPKGHGSKKQTYAQWRKYAPSAETQRDILNGLALWKASDQWQRGYVKAAERWLRDFGWTDTPPEQPRASPNGQPISSQRRRQQELLAIANGDTP